MASARVLEDLSDGEAYLYALLQDMSGIDMAEFSMQDPTTDDGLFRCYDYQYPWWRCRDKLQISSCARSVGKSLSLQIRSCAFSFTNPGEHLMITAPELIHLRPIAQGIEEKMLSSRLMREMLRKTKTSNGITHNPLVVRFKNGAKIEGRIPQRDGRGLKGAHPTMLEIDEGQDMPAPAYNEVIETLKFGDEKSRWRISGVTTGERNHFWKFSQPNSGWKVHRITAVHRPDWSGEERAAKIELYGGRDNSNYRRNVHGEHGDSNSPIFVTSRLLACVDDNPSSDYNQEYWTGRVASEDVQTFGDVYTAIDSLVDPPTSHRQLKNVWIGADIGMTTSPTEILVFASRNDAEFRLMSRLNLTRISAPGQRYAFEQLWEIYRPAGFAMDRTGLGLPIYSEIVESPSTANQRGLANVMIGYNFSEKILVGHEPDEHGFMEEIEARVLDHSTDVLRRLVDDRDLVLPWDVEIVRDFQGQSVAAGGVKMDSYGKARRKGNAFHLLDAARMAALAFKLKDVRPHTESHEVILDTWL